MDPANLLTKWHWIVELARKKLGTVLFSGGRLKPERVASVDATTIRPSGPSGARLSLYRSRRVARDTCCSAILPAWWPLATAPESQLTSERKGRD